MTVPPEAITEAIRGGALDDPFLSKRARVKIMLEAAAPLIAAAERDRRQRDLIGYKIGDKLYHPSDVTIVLRGEPS